MSRASAEAALAHAVGAFCSKQCGVSFGAFFSEDCVHVATFFFFFFLILLFGLFLFGATPNRWAIPVRKALLIIPADVGECVNVREIKPEERERGRLQTALVHFSPSSSRCV